MTTGHRAMPVLAVADVAASVAFYRDKLGFSVGGMWPDAENPGFAIVGMGTIIIALDRDPEAGAQRHGWCAYLYIDDVDAYHAELAARGVEIARMPEDAFYGCRDMDVRDPDGNLLAFGQDLQPGPEGPGL